MRRRALQGYGTNADMNAHIFRDDIRIRDMWLWIRDAHIRRHDGEYYVGDDADASFYGIYDIMRLRGRHLKYLYGQSQLEAQRCEQPAVIPHTQLGGQRRLALAYCGWGLYGFIREQHIRALESAGEFSAAAGTSFIYGDHQRCLQSLEKSSAQDQKLLSFMLKAQLDMNNVLVPTQADKGALAPGDMFGCPHLQMIFAYLATGDWNRVVGDIAGLPMSYRLAIALRYLDDGGLMRFLLRAGRQAVRRGELDGILITGVSGSGRLVMQAYVDNTADVQTAALVSIFDSSSDAVANETAELWIYGYRHLLNKWRMFTTRCLFDIAHGNYREAKELARLSDVSEKIAVRPVDIRCTYCHKSIGHGPSARKDRPLRDGVARKDVSSASTPGTGAIPGAPLDMAAAATAAAGVDGGPAMGAAGRPLLGMATAGAVTGGRSKDQQQGQMRLLYTLCPKCPSSLPRCVVCRLKLGVPVLPSATDVPAPPGGDFSQWFSWCQTCGHGGHVVHMQNWFETHTECPVPAARVSLDDSCGADSGPKADGGREFTVGRVLLRRLRRVGAAALADPGGGRLGRGCTALVAGKLAAEVVYYYAGTLPSEFYRVLGDRDAGGFVPLLARCVALVAAAGASKATLEYAAALLGVAMRRALTQHTHRRYLRRPGFYAVAGGGAVDNPDQRITQDIQRLASGATEVVPELLIAPFLIAYYSFRCWSMSGLFGPLAIYAYFGLGAVATRLAMAPIIRHVWAQERAEGDFRFGHVRAGEFAEAIAFYGGEAREHSEANGALEAVVDAQKQVLWKQLHLGLLVQIFAYLGSTVSYVIIGVPILLGAYDDKSGAELSSLISLNAFVSMYLIFRFSSVIEQSKRLADVAGYATRIVQLWEELDAVDSAPAAAPGQASTGIEAVQLAVCTPGSGRRLVSGLDLAIGAGDALLITGRNGAGKTAVLRTLCGLWPPAAGEVRLPCTDGAPDVFFLPQAPYIISGSLRDQISYPGVWGGRQRLCSDEAICALLSAVGLAQLGSVAGGPGLDHRWSVQEWLRLLSPGEQQKIAIARVLFWRPTFAALDECTSALDAASEEALYRALQDAGITTVSVSHHRALAKFHRWRLALDGRGGHALGAIS
ncbi:hypothetical protein H4R19_002485 [Coemansia spiralis]|nr:hypothetical protein H4R19_002485 [Coemansia spiralis]